MFILLIVVSLRLCASEPSNTLEIMLDQALATIEQQQAVTETLQANMRVLQAEMHLRKAEMEMVQSDVDSLQADVKEIQIHSSNITCISYMFYAYGYIVVQFYIKHFMYS